MDYRIELREPNEHNALRWQVYGPVFGREFLLAAFLTEDDARTWLQARTDGL